MPVKVSPSKATKPSVQTKSLLRNKKRTPNMMFFIVAGKW
jgi:hypothetical protein